MTGDQLGQSTGVEERGLRRARAAAAKRQALGLCAGSAVTLDGQ